MFLPSQSKVASMPNVPDNGRQRCGAALDKTTSRLARRGSVHRCGLRNVGRDQGGSFRGTAKIDWPCRSPCHKWIPHADGRGTKLTEVGRGNGHMVELPNTGPFRRQRAVLKSPEPRVRGCPPAGITVLCRGVPFRREQRRRSVATLRDILETRDVSVSKVLAFPTRRWHRLITPHRLGRSMVIHDGRTTVVPVRTSRHPDHANDQESETVSFHCNVSLIVRQGFAAAVRKACCWRLIARAAPVVYAVRRHRAARASPSIGLSWLFRADPHSELPVGSYRPCEPKNAAFEIHPLISHQAAKSSQAQRTACFCSMGR